MEKSFIMIKPDGLERALMGEIISRIENKGLKIVGAKLIRPEKEIVENHYLEHKEKPFFNELVEFISNGKVMAMIVEGQDVIRIMRNLIGDKDPLQAIPGTIRGDFSYSTTENVIHGSDSIESAKREINIWFKEEK